MADFVYSCENAGIEKLLFIRHANAEPASGSLVRKDVPHDWKRSDQMRPLSKKGKDQCKDKSKLLKNFDIRINLSSPARRATETAMMLTLDAAAGGEISLRMIESLHPAGMSDKCEDLFDEMGYGPLQKFADVGAKEPFENYGRKVCEEMNIKVSGPGINSMRGDAMAMFGHAVFINSVAYVVATEWGIPNADDIMGYDLGEADAILVDKRANSVSYIRE